jgi:hypothetical protein
VYHHAHFYIFVSIHQVFSSQYFPLLAPIQLNQIFLVKSLVDHPALRRLEAGITEIHLCMVCAIRSVGLLVGGLILVSFEGLN